MFWRIKNADSRLRDHFRHPDLLTKFGHAIGTTLVKFVAARPAAETLKRNKFISIVFLEIGVPRIKH